VISELAELLGPDEPEVARFGNHNRKFLFQLQRYGFEMAQLAREAGLTLNQYPDEPEAEIERLRIHSGERAPYTLGAYFGLHYLKLNASTVLRLREEAGVTRDRYALYRHVLGNYERRLGLLVRALLPAYVTHFAGGASLPRYTVLNVGSFTDHEDIDVALVADAPKGDEGGLDGIVGHLSQEFFRRAVPLHFYLSEHLEQNRYWGSLSDYQQLLDVHLKDFVVVCQVLTATRLTGSRSLYRVVMQEVHRRYLSPEESTRHREGFLRGTLGELDVLLGQRDRSEDALNPKREVYRLIKLLVAAVRTIHGITHPTILTNLETLRQYDPEHEQEYRNLRRAFAFNEVFRYLYNLLVVPEDEIRLDRENVPETLSEIGLLMGFGRDARGPLQALLLTYAEHLARSLQAGLALSHLLRDHLKEISLFRRLLADGLTPVGPGSKRRGAALELLEDVKKDRSRIFWDDIQEVIQESPETLVRFIDDLGRLPEEDREQAVRTYVLLMTSDLESLLELLVFLPGLRGRPRRREMARLFLEATLECLRAFSYKLRDYGKAVTDDPDLLARFIAAHPPEVADRLARILAEGASDRRFDRLILWHRTLSVTEHERSKYFTRLLARVLDRLPEVKRLVGEPGRVRELVSEIHREAERAPTAPERRRLLGDAFDLEMLRLGLGTLLLGESPERYLEYLQTVDGYLTEVLKTCMHEVQESRPVFSRLNFPAGLSLYATGGNARGEGLGDDYDFVALIDSRAASAREFFNRSVGKLVAAISRHGLLAHNRFAENFNTYALTIDDLAVLLDNPGAEGFIDQSELVDARLVVGDQWTDGRLQREILGARVWDRADLFLSKMVEELQAHESFMSGRGDEGIDVKQGPGGLRMINMVLLMAKARLRVREPLTAGALPLLSEAMPELAEDLEQLEQARRFIKRVRDAYRLGVAYSDVVLPELLGELVPFVYGATDRRGGEELVADLLAAMETARNRVWALTEKLTRGRP